MSTYKINSTGTSIIADKSFMDVQYPNDYTMIADVVVVKVDPAEWLIDHGPLLDRFGGTIKLAFLESTIPRVIALRTDYYSRKWIDLKNQELQAGFYYMAGVTVPVLGTISVPIAGLTPAIVAGVFATPVEHKDNLAIRKTYFS